jgi:hypothetical protein
MVMLWKFLGPPNLSWPPFLDKYMCTRCTLQQHPSPINHTTINHTTINHTTINHTTINHTTINHTTIEHTTIYH